MWLKVMGLVCAGVFVGAAYREVTEHRRRKREHDRDHNCPRQDSCKGNPLVSIGKEGDGHAPQPS